jgi:hypothetical protein
MVRFWRGDALDDLSDEELDALLAPPTATPSWAGNLAVGATFVFWLLLSCGWVNNFFLAPLGCAFLAVLAVRRLRSRPVGRWLFAATTVATAWSLFVLGSILVWSPSTPSTTTVAARPGDLTIDQQIRAERAHQEFLDVAYQKRDLDRYRKHVVGRPGISLLTGCWDGTPMRAQSSERRVRKRDEDQEDSVIDVDITYLLKDAIYHARLEVTADGWQVVGLDRVPGFEHCPMGFPVPPAPGE